MIQLVPSLPAQSYSELKTLADNLSGTSKELQIDIVDGEFVTVKSWPFTENDVFCELDRLGELSADFALEVDCMVVNPYQYLDTLVKAGVKKVIIHYGSTENYEDIFAHSEKYDYQVGLAIKNDVNVSDIESLLPNFDYVQVMGIREIGQQGQPFDERTLETIKNLKEKWPELLISVDGSVNAETLPLLKEAGARRFAPGSAITKAADPKEAYIELLALIEG